MRPGLYQQLFDCAWLDFAVFVQNPAHCAFFGLHSTCTQTLSILNWCLLFTLKIFYAAKEMLPKPR